MLRGRLCVQEDEGAAYTPLLCAQTSGVGVRGERVKTQISHLHCLLNWRRRRAAERVSIICYSVLNISIMLLHWYGKLRAGYKMLIKITILGAV